MRYLQCPSLYFPGIGSGCHGCNAGCTESDVVMHVLPHKGHPPPWAERAGRPKKSENFETPRAGSNRPYPIARVDGGSRARIFMARDRCPGRVVADFQAFLTIFMVWPLARPDPHRG